MSEGSNKEDSRPVILVVDDKKNMLGLLTKILEPDMRVLTANNGTEAVGILEKNEVDVVLSDLRMPDMDGLQVLETVKKLRPQAEFVLMTAYASVATAIQALRLGAYDYLTKPFDPEDAKAMLKKAAGKALSRRGAITNPLDEILPGMLARSEAMKELARMVRRVAASSTTALLLGETGTGQERVARAIHQLSPRANERFVAVNCAAIPAELLESELFGFVKGSFSGADRDRKGLFEEADGGTLFLDEIGEMRLSLQAKLTRVLEERAIRRVGDSMERPVDLRLIAATHRDLEALISKGDFREDLWYRLNVASLELPPLRKRRDDIELLAEHFLSQRTSTADESLQGFSPEVLATMMSYDWPGNVRQLKAAVERAALLTTGPQIELGDLPPTVRKTGTKTHGLEALCDLPWSVAVEQGRIATARTYLEGVLAREGGSVSAAARHAQVERESFYRLMRKYGVTSPKRKEP